MRTIYLMLTIIGFATPNFLVLQESLETGNILLYADPAATISGMFANRISTIFTIDLLVTVAVFFLWSYHEAKRLHIKGIAWVWAATMLFGLGGGFPLFLYLRTEKEA